MKDTYQLPINIFTLMKQNFFKENNLFCIKSIFLWLENIQYIREYSGYLYYYIVLYLYKSVDVK